MAATRASRIVVVGGDDFTISGYEAVIGRQHDVASLVALLHPDAVRVPSWRGVDAVLVDPVDRTSSRDRLAGLAVVDRIRSESPGAGPRIILVTDLSPDHAVRARAAEAGVDGYCRRADLSADDLWRCLLGAQGQGVPAPDQEVLDDLGVTERTRINVAVALALRLPARVGSWSSSTRADFLGASRLDAPVGAQADDIRIEPFLDWAMATEVA